MNNPYRQNPFEILHLDPSADNQEVIAQAGRLRQRAIGEPEVTALRQAVQALTGAAEERFVQQMLTHPRPCCHWPDLDRFRAAFRRPPQPAAGELPPCPSLDVHEFTRALEQAVGPLHGLPHGPGPEGQGRSGAENEPWESARDHWQELLERFPG